MAAIRNEFITQIVNLLPERLNLDDVLANGCRRTKLVFQPACRREVICMGVGIQYPFHRNSGFPHVIQKTLRVPRGCGS